ncbi:MAG TPA: UDP-N-acetylglucosamine--N-acetylmuramyl-(pentapeptide) pyrophosphoryl-undecaprenol N-acetylglucosamine transferase [Chlamydiales bacterium]|jgi:UDP-N-acetylglucosamine--N-acetylmuramyl-(pentapeptide) pyrophosphoryl-undecaprenol N-acetylglucosamine transferase
MKKILIAAGGTGGHLLPAQQLAELLQREEAQVIFAGYKLDKSPYFQREKFDFREIPAAPLSGWKFFSQLLVGGWKAFRLFLKEKPDVVVGFGSYHTAPVLLAATLLGKKIVLFEANRTLGKVNRLFRPFAKKVAWQFLPSRAHPSKDLLVAPFPWIFPPKKDSKSAREELGLDPDKFTALVFGGSQGAAFLNEIMPQVASALPHMQWIHIAGNETAATQVRLQYGPRAKVFSFTSNMPLLYAAADAALCRSGAGTVSELLRFHVPALLIPFPHATDNHQKHNADLLVEKGGAICLDQAEATLEALKKNIETLDWKRMHLALRSVEEQNHSLMKLEHLINEL